MNLVNEIVNQVMCLAINMDKIADTHSSTESLDLIDNEKYQAEIIFNRHLPYADQISKEADDLLVKIKMNFGRCVLLQDIYPGSVYWSQILNRYILLYGLRFTKDEHVAFIKFVYQLIIIPNLQPSAVNTFVKLLIPLLKKKEIISPEDLELEWKPLYVLCQTILTRRADTYSVYKYPYYLETNLENLVTIMKFYFSPNAPQEILDELRPKLCPFDTTTMNLTIKLLRWFLPLQLSTEHHGVVYELLKFWEVCHNATFWEKDMMRLMAKLAMNNIGYIDWNPYMAIMFTRFLRALNLPVEHGKLPSKFNLNIEMSSIAEWIAWVLGDNSNTQTYLDKFLKTIETYFHPANYGGWFNKIEYLFFKLTYFVVIRLHKERHAKRTWLLSVPENYKLRDANIDAFINCMMPLAMTAVYNKRCSPNFYSALQYLALLRPNIVIPRILEKFYPTLGTNIEPHKIIIAMNSLSSVARPLVQGSRYFIKAYAFQEGPSHVLPILFSSLSGLDPNDPKKCLATLKLIATYCTLIPIVDCSNSQAKIHDDDRAICAETSQFEDFVLQFMDRIFVLIDASSVESVRLENQADDGESSSLEKFILSTIEGSFMSIFLQTSDSIFSSALKKLRSFIIENTLERKIAGQIVSAICLAFSAVNSRLTLRALLPLLTEKVLETIGKEDSNLEEENLDNDLLYMMLLLQRLVITSGNELLAYVNTIIEMLDKVTALKSREGNKLGCQILQNILNSFCDVQILRLDRSLNDSKYPYWEDWGKSINVPNAQITWYVPGEKEMAAAQSIFSRYFLPAVNNIQNYINKKSPLSREELQTTLRIIYSVVEGCDSVLPSWSENPLVNERYEACSLFFEPIIGNVNQINMPNGTNVRHFLVELLSNLQDNLLQNREDDIKSLILLVKIWEFLSMNKAEAYGAMKDRRETFYLMKKLVEDKLIGNKGYLPEVLIERVHLQHELRKVSATYAFTQTSKNIMLSLFKLSISQYSTVRMKAQRTVWSIMNDFPNSYAVIVPHILEVLARDTEIHHDAYKGALFLITQSPGNSLLCKSDWQLLSKLLPALVLSKPSEKSSIIRQQNFITSVMTKNFTTINITLTVENMDSCISSALELWNTGIKPIKLRLSESEIQKGAEVFAELKNNNIKIYYDLLDKLLHAVLEKNLHWRHREISTKFINTLVHPEVLLPTAIIRYYLNSLIHDSIYERKMAWTTTVHIFKQLKRKKLKIEQDITECQDLLQPGIRVDNVWLQYRHDKRPTTEVEWNNESRYVHKKYIGYYMWMKKLHFYAAASKQPDDFQNSNRSLNEKENEIELFFKDQQNVDKLIEFLKLEEHKGRDAFNPCRSRLLKGLFRNHGDKFLNNFLDHLRIMVQDKQESSQRCASEIICGIVRGSKHWTFSMSQNLWESLVPIIKLALTNLTEETVNDWVSCFSLASYNRDPYKQHWLIECLVQETQFASTTSFIECAQIRILDSTLRQTAWRLSEILNELILRFEARLLDDPFENIRIRLADILVTIFRVNLKFQKKIKVEGMGYPEIEDFVNRLYPRVEILLFKNDSNSPEYIQSMRLLITLCHWMQRYIRHSFYSVDPSFYRLYPIISHLESCENNEELSKTCTTTLAVLAQAFTLPSEVPLALQAIESVSKSSSWSTRASSAKFLQGMLFSNMSTLLSNESWIDTIRAITLRLLQDDRVEVREKAARILTGMLHCALLTDREVLLEEFKELAKTKLRKKKDVLNLDNLLSLRHAGILGMCSFIQAHPYDVPKDIPPILQYLNLHLNDPEPIPATIRKTMNDFKRTHLDGWTGLQGLAQDLTKEQFELLQDLTIPSSYYA